MIYYSNSFGFDYLNRFDFGCLKIFLNGHWNSIYFESLNKYGYYLWYFDIYCSCLSYFQQRVEYNFLGLKETGLKQNLKRVKTRYSCYQFSLKPKFHLINNSTWASCASLVDSV